MNKSILIINGPNLNLLGTRQPDIYGSETLEKIKLSCEQHCKKKLFNSDFRQSNSESQLINWIQEAAETHCGIIINPGGYSHTSIAIMDALLATPTPIIEVHISNIHQREEYRNHSFTAKAAKGIICGLGGNGYLLAIDAIAHQIDLVKKV